MVQHCYVFHLRTSGATNNLASYCVAIVSHYSLQSVLVCRRANVRVEYLLLSFWCCNLDSTNNDL